ncbi:hypothetical protein LDK20_01400 [Fusobacterium nucleatum]|uniref:hypothetical protein n=1 Tax=Fusobacterium TaxID=848 RepID=UPI001237ADAE|nr:hypothetical protein [Fusobacterium nucleatum]WDA45596.1 hypothetical protein PSR67_08005 [Fusobacterium nucleatum]
MKKLVSILFLVISVFSFSAWEYYEKEETQGIKPIKKILIVDGKKSLELNKDDEYVFSYYLDDKIDVDFKDRPRLYDMTIQIDDNQPMETKVLTGLGVTLFPRLNFKEMDLFIYNKMIDEMETGKVIKIKVPDKNVNIEFSLDNFFNVYKEYFGN